MFAQIDGRKIYFDVEGVGLSPVGSVMVERPVLLVIHGSLFEHSYFKPILSPLADHFQIIYFDQRGFGRSQSCSSSDWSFDVLVNDVAALIGYLGLSKVFILGHSFGASVAVKVANRYPDILENCILLNPVSSNLDYFYENLVVRAGSEVADLAIETLVGQREDLLDVFFAKVFPYLSETPLSDALMSRGQMNVPLAFRSFELIRDVCWRSELSNLHVKTLILSGGRDIYNPEAFFTELVESTANSMLSITEFSAAGHMAMLDVPDLILEKIRSVAARADKSLEC